MNSFNSKSFNISFKKLTLKDLIIFLIPFIIFCTYLYVYNPGIIDVDPFYQLHEIAINQFDNWHPFFHTFIEMQLLNIYPNTVIICLFQIILFSTFWTIICNYNREDDVPITSRQFLLQVIFTLIISLIPVNAAGSIILHKDILFSYFIMFLCFLIKVVIDKKGNVSYKFIIVLSIIMAITSQLRPNGIYIIAIMLIILAIYFLKKNTSRNYYILLPIFTIIFILLIGSLDIAYHVEDRDKDAIFTKTSHMLADYDLNIDMNNEDREKIYKMMREEDILENYQITFSDPIYRASNQNVYNQYKATYIEMAIMYSLKNPLHCIEYLLGSAPIIWDITRDTTWKGNVLNTYTDYARDVYYQRSGLVPVGGYDNASSVNKGTPIYDSFESFISITKENEVLSTVFYSPALYMYLSLFLLVGIQILSNSKEIYLVYLPNLLNIIIVFLSIPVQDCRYLYANLLVCYLLIIILIDTKYKSDTHHENSKPIPIIQDNLGENKILKKEDMQTNISHKEMEDTIRAKILKELEEKKMKNK